MTKDEPINETLYELQCIKQWGEKYGWGEPVKNLVNARITSWETLLKKRRIGK